MTARERGHDVCYVTPDDFILRPDDGMSIRAIVPKKKKYKDGEEWIATIQGENTPVKTIDIEDVAVSGNSPRKRASSFSTIPGGFLARKTNSTFRVSLATCAPQR